MNLVDISTITWSTLEVGNGADRQLRVFHETGDLKKVVDFIIEETEVGVAEQAASVSERKVG